MLKEKPLKIYVCGPYTAKTLEEKQKNVNNAIEVEKRGIYAEEVR